MTQPRNKNKIKRVTEMGKKKKKKKKNLIQATKINFQDLSYKEKHWHESCFVCSKCRASLVDKQVISWTMLQLKTNLKNVHIVVKK